MNIVINVDTSIPKTHVYLASRYSRRLELCEYRKQIEAAGMVVSSRWLNGAHQISDAGIPISDHGERLVEGDDGSETDEAAKLRQSFAHEDVSDVCDADVLVAFTEPPRSSASRGGRHVELGIAIGLRLSRGGWDNPLEIFVVGHRENIFCWLEFVRFFPTWEECLAALQERQSKMVDPFTVL